MSAKSVIVETLSWTWTDACRPQTVCMQALRTDVVVKAQQLSDELAL